MKTTQPKVVHKDIASRYNSDKTVVKIPPTKSKPRGCGAATKGCKSITVY